MAWADLSAEDQEQVKAFCRDYRAAFAQTVNGLYQQVLLKQAYDTYIGALWTQIGANEIIPDGTGLAGADTTMTRAQFDTKLLWSTEIVKTLPIVAAASVYVWPSRDTVIAHAVQLVGPSNVVQ